MQMVKLRLYILPGTKQVKNASNRRKDVALFNPASLISLTKNSKQMNIKLTNPAETLKFVSFLAEAMPHVEMHTPTEINKGGCGFFAALLYDKLVEAGMKPKIVALFFDEVGEDSNEEVALLEKYLKTGTDVSGAGFDHCVILVEGLYVDSHGIVNGESIAAIKTDELTREQLDAINKGSKHLNKVFNRHDVPIIKNLLDDVFSKYDTFKHGIFDIPSKIEADEETRRNKMKYESIDGLFDLLGMVR
jgi:hypothetical protein